MRKKEEEVDDQTTQRRVLKAMLLKDKSRLIAVEKHCYCKTKTMLLQSRQISLLWERLWALKISRMKCLRNWRAKDKEGAEKRKVSGNYKQQNSTDNVEMLRWKDDELNTECRQTGLWKTGKWAREEARWGSLGKARGDKRATNRAENWCNVACHSSSKTCFCASQQVARTRQHQSFWLWHRFLPCF